MACHGQFEALICFLDMTYVINFQMNQHRNMSEMLRRLQGFHIGKLSVPSHRKVGTSIMMVLSSLISSYEPHGTGSFWDIPVAHRPDAT